MGETDPAKLICHNIPRDPALTPPQAIKSCLVPRNQKFSVSLGRLSHQNPETAATPTCADVEVPQSRVAAQLLKEGRKLIFKQFLHFEEREAGFRWSPDLSKSRGTEEGLQQSLWFPKPSFQGGRVSN